MNIQFVKFLDRQASYFRKLRKNFENTRKLGFVYINYKPCIKIPIFPTFILLTKFSPELK